MSYSFEYIDIILLAMIAGFIFLRLRGILGKRTGFDGKAPPKFEEVLNKIKTEKVQKINENFDDFIVDIFIIIAANDGCRRRWALNAFGIGSFRGLGLRLP